MSNGFEQLVTALQNRYDFQSARTMAREALSVASLKEQPNYSKEELQQFVDGLAKVGSHLDRVWSILGVSPTGEPAPAAEAAAPKAAEAPKAEEKKEAKEEAKADDKKDAKADDKKDDKKDAKADDKKDAKADDKKDDEADDKKGGKKK
jgi:hypothetical protein